MLAITLWCLVFGPASANAAAITVSGTAYADQVGGIWAGCDGITPNVSVQTSGGRTNVPCAAGTGAWSAATTANNSEFTTVWLDVNGVGDKGATILRLANPVGNATGVVLTAQQMRIASYDPAYWFVNGQLAAWDDTLDADVPLTLGATMFVPNGVEFVVGAGTRYESDDLSTMPADVDALQIDGVWTKNDIHSSRDVTIRGIGTGSCTSPVGAAAPLCGNFQNGLGGLSFVGVGDISVRGGISAAWVYHDATIPETLELCAGGGSYAASNSWFGGAAALTISIDNCSFGIVFGSVGFGSETTVSGSTGCSAVFVTGGTISGDVNLSGTCNSLHINGNVTKSGTAVWNMLYLHIYSAASLNVDAGSIEDILSLYLSTSATNGSTIFGAGSIDLSSASIQASGTTTARTAQVSLAFVGGDIGSAIVHQTRLQIGHASADRIGVGMIDGNSVLDLTSAGDVEFSQCVYSYGTGTASLLINSTVRAGTTGDCDYGTIYAFGVANVSTAATLMVTYGGALARLEVPSKRVEAEGPIIIDVPGAYSAITGPGSISMSRGTSSIANLSPEGALVLAPGVVIQPTLMQFETTTTFTPSTGRVEFVNGGTSTLSVPAGTNWTFHSLRVAGANTNLGLSVMNAGAAPIITVNGVGGGLNGFTMDGGSCATQARISMGSSTLAATGSRSLQYARFLSGNFAPAVNATNSSHAWSNVTGVTVSYCVTTVSGFAYNADGVTPWSGCGLAGRRVAVRSRAAASATLATCSGVTGAYTANTVVNLENDVAAAWLHGDPTARGVAYLRQTGPGFNSTATNVLAENARITDTSNIEPGDMGWIDVDMDAQIPVQSDGIDVATVLGTRELSVEFGSVLDMSPDDNGWPGWYANNHITAASLDLAGTISQYTTTSSSITLTASGTGDCSGGPGVQRPFCMRATSDGRAGNVRFTGTGNVLIAGRDGDEFRFNDLKIEPAAGGAVYTIGNGPGQIIGVTQDFVIGTGAHAVTVQLAATAPQIRVASSCLGGGCDPPGSMVVNSGATLQCSVACNFHSWVGMSGAGTINFTAGTLYRYDHSGKNAGRDFGPTGASDWTFYDVVVDMCEAPVPGVVVNAGVGALHVLNDLRVMGASTVLDMATNDKGIDVDRDVIVEAGGTLRPPPSSPFTIQRNLVVQGAVDAASGTVEFDGAGTSRIDLSADTEIAGLEVYQPSKRLELDSAYTLTVSGVTATTGLRVNGSACGTRVTLATDVPGVPALLDATGADSVQYVLVDNVQAVAPGISALHAHPAALAPGWSIVNGNCSAITVSLPGGASTSMPSAYPGSESSAQVQVDVTSDSNTGYQLWATDTSDTVSFTNPLPATMADYPTQTPAAPTTWAPGVSGASGYGGVTVLSATGGRLAAWGSGSTTLTDYVSNRYLGLLSGTSTLLHEAVAPVAGDQIQLGVRVTPATTSPPGNYSQSITFTALYKP